MPKWPRSASSSGPMGVSLVRRRHHNGIELGLRHVSSIVSIPNIEAKGTKIPLVGLGTWELRGRVCARVVEQALRLGYRHIDTAEIYDNEREVGEALRVSGVKRDDVFLTTKIWPSHFAPHELERAAKGSLARLRLSEINLLL